MLPGASPDPDICFLVFFSFSLKCEKRKRISNLLRDHSSEKDFQACLDLILKLSFFTLQNINITIKKFSLHFTASMSVTGKDPKVKPGAVDIVRHWQELGIVTENKSCHF